MTWSAGAIDPLQGTHQYGQSFFNALKPHWTKTLTKEFFRIYMEFTDKQLNALSSDVQYMFIKFPISEWGKTDRVIDAIRDILLLRWESALNVPNELCATGLGLKDGIFAAFTRKFAGYRKRSRSGRRGLRTGCRRILIQA
jgi:hypothetical protein